MILQNIALKTEFLTSSILFFLLAVIILFFLYIRGQKRFALISLFSISITSLLVIFLKNTIATPRPANALIELTSFAFPSGHAALSTSIACLFVWIFFQTQKNIFYRTMLSISIILVAGFIMYTRLILGVHTFGQIFAGIITGISVFFLVLLIESKLIKNSD